MIRVAAAYALVAWIVVEVASVLLPTLLLPGWSVRSVTVLAMLGFPIALVLLAKQSNLRVVSRTTSFALRGSALDVRFQALLEHMSSPRSGE